MNEIIILSLSNLVGHYLPDDALNCPVRALRLYLNKTDSYRGDRNRLFLSQIQLCQKDIAPGLNRLLPNVIHSPNNVGTVKSPLGDIKFMPYVPLGQLKEMYP